MSNNPSPNTEFQPLNNICEFLNALHIYTDEARRGITRSVEANHYCSHVRKDLRQCLIYDTSAPSARLIGVEYMVPAHVYLSLPAPEQKLWHSHEFEVKSGMLVLPKPSGIGGDEWEEMELKAMREVVGLYGKTWHFWQTDRGDELPLGYPKLMGSLTDGAQLDLDLALWERDKLYDRKAKAYARRHIECPGVAENADSWWKESAAFTSVFTPSVMAIGGICSIIAISLFVESRRGL